MKKISFIYFNEFFHDSRGEKEARSLIRLGYDLSIFAYRKNDRSDHLDAQKPGLAKYVQRLPINRIRKIPMVGRLVALVYFNLWIFQKCRGHQVIHIHSPLLLPIAFVIKKLSRRAQGVRVLYDCHEIEWDKSGVTAAIQYMTKVFEQVFISKIDCVITVNEKIAQMYKERYSIENVSVVENFPAWHRPAPSVVLRETFSISDETVVFVYVGRLTKGRGIEQWIEAVTTSGRDVALVLVGYGPMEEDCVAWARHFGSVHFQPAMTQKDLIEFIQSADFGINTPPLISASRKQALPNKLFEYLSAGLEVIVNSGSYRSEFVRQFDCGYVIEDCSTKSIKSLIDSFTTKRPSVRKDHCFAIANKYTWENIEHKLIELYQ